jgi:TRAP-type uncharacterized transport system fused permease subunit
MLVCIILGMGLPTTAAYVLGAAVLAPALISLGLPALIAHLFVMYFACLSAITPPVCVAVFMAAGLAKAKWTHVGTLSCLIAIPAFVVPYTFCYNPALLLIGNPLDIALGVLTALVGVCFIDFAIIGYIKGNMPLLFRLTAFSGGIFMLIPDMFWSLVGLILGAGSFAFSFVKRNPPASARQSGHE